MEQAPRPLTISRKEGLTHGYNVKTNMKNIFRHKKWTYSTRGIGKLCIHQERHWWRIIWVRKSQSLKTQRKETYNQFRISVY